jgi:transposase
MAYRAQTKGKVERPIDPLKRFLESEVFLPREHLRRELQKFIQEDNEKVHSTTREKPVDRLEH